MANEAVLVLKYQDPIDFIVADGAAITKGDLLKLTNPRTAASTDGANQVFAGIAARDKVANDGRTRLAVFRHGVFRLKTNGAITAGNTVAIHAANTVKAAAAANVGSQIVGIALENAADGAEIEVELNIAAGNNAYA